MKADNLIADSCRRTSLYPDLHFGYYTFRWLNVPSQCKYIMLNRFALHFAFAVLWLILILFHFQMIYAKRSLLNVMKYRNNVKLLNCIIVLYYRARRSFFEERGKISAGYHYYLKYKNRLHSLNIYCLGDFVYAFIV